MLAINEFREFLSFYPTNPRADYAQYKLGMAHFRQMRAPQRDQTETRDAIKEFETFVARYPNSTLMPEAKKQAARGARPPERVGLPGRATSTSAASGIRARSIACRRCSRTTRSSRGRDAVYFYPGESLVKMNRQAEALPLLREAGRGIRAERVLDEGEKRMTELKAKGLEARPARGSAEARRSRRVPSPRSCRRRRSRQAERTAAAAVVRLCDATAAG